jgi:hypothetical protein
VPHVFHGSGARRPEADAARCGLDPELATLDDAVHPTFVQDRGSIGAEVAEAGGRELEVVWLGNPEEHGRGER